MSLGCQASELVEVSSLQDTWNFGDGKLIGEIISEDKGRRLRERW
jgi:hypothetical protein